MPKVIKATELHNKTRDVLEWARIDGEDVVVEYFGKPIVAIVRFAEYQKYLRYKDMQRDNHSEQLELLGQLDGQNAASVA